MINSNSDILFGIVLAAGESSRLGEPKQLVEYHGHTLLGHAVERLRPVVGDRLIVVLGAGWQEIFERCRADLGFFALNDDWRDGLASSLRTACRAVPQNAAGILVTLTDQPRVSKTHLAALRDCWAEHPQRIVASRYSDGAGVPAVLPARLFASIRQLRGDHGAQALFEQNRDVLELIDCPDAAIDIDTREDLNRLRRG